ncbi:hypothetical protein E4U61_007485, partial [Claviceps capensis]
MSFFPAGLPFSLVEHPKFVAFLNRLRPAFRSPPRKAIANQYLDRADGWTNVRGESIINYVLVTPESGAYFHSSASYKRDLLRQRRQSTIEPHLPRTRDDGATGRRDNENSRAFLLYKLYRLLLIDGAVAADRVYMMRLNIFDDVHHSVSQKISGVRIYTRCLTGVKIRATLGGNEHVVDDRLPTDIGPSITDK